MLFRSFSDLSRLIIDLRGNTVGYQSSVKNVCGLFIGRDKVYLKQRDVYGNEVSDYTPNTTYYDNFRKIVVLIDENTASAAEVCAICLKEQHEDVTLVGTTTFGKGVIQSTIPLKNGAALKMTTYYWYSPNGVSVHGKGIAPDVEVRMPDIYYMTYEDIDEDTSYGYDDVSDNVGICQYALDYLGYEVDRTDGYFSQDTQEALKAFEGDRGLAVDGMLDSETFQALISSVTRSFSLDQEKDPQLVKAKEIINEYQH